MSQTSLPLTHPIDPQLAGVLIANMLEAWLTAGSALEPTEEAVDEHQDYPKRFAEGGLRFPKRAYGGAWAGRLIWGRLSHERVLGLIRNPSYAGIYVFGRYQYRQRITPQGEVHKRVQPVSKAEWRV